MGNSRSPEFFPACFFPHALLGPGGGGGIILFLQILMQWKGSDFFPNLSVYVVKSRDITLMWEMEAICQGVSFLIMGG